MNSSTRILINTTTVYLRSLLGIGLALFSSRWMLQGLGVTDFGLFNLVGSLIVFLLFFNSVMSNSAARHFSYALGQNDSDGVNRWFNSSLCIHLILPLLLILPGYPLGDYAIRHWLVIPADRIEACLNVFRVSLLAAYVNMASIPFVAMFNAKQRIAELSAWDMLYSFLAFLLAGSLFWVSSDRLFFYASGVIAVSILTQSIKIARARRLFPECNVRLRAGMDRTRLKELFHFASWSAIGSLGGVLRNQGSGILFNLYFGPHLNAAYGVANQVSAQAGMLSAALFGAISPEIAAREGRGERTRMLALSVTASKLGTFLAMIVAMPLIHEMNFVLNLWLKTPPPHASLLCQLMLLTFMLDRLSYGYMSAISAYGRIAAYQATIGGLLVLTLPLAWALVALGHPPASVGIAFVVMQSACSVGRVAWARRYFKESLRAWFSGMLFPALACATVSFSCATVLQQFFHPSLCRFVTTTLASFLGITWGAWFLLFTASDRHFLGQLVRQTISRSLGRAKILKSGKPGDNHAHSS